MADEHSQAPGESAANHPQPAQAGMDPRKRRLFILVAIVVVALLIVVAVIWWLIARQYEKTDDAYIDARITHLSPQIAGRVLHVYANDNLRVRAGQLLVDIDPADVRARYDQAQAQESQAEAQLAQTRAQIRVSEANYQQVRAMAVGAAAQAENAARDLKRYRDLRQTLPSAVADQQLDQVRTTAVNTAAQRDAAVKQAQAAQAQVDAVQTQVTGAEAQLKTAQAQLEQAHLNLSYAQIVAPTDGTVAQQSVAVGNYVQPGQELLAIVPLQLWITANYKETQLERMRPGQQVDIRIDAYPGVHFTGHVDSIQRGAGQAFSLLPAENATGNFVKVAQRVPVKILIDGPNDSRYVLGPGMSVYPSVHVR